MSTKGKSWRARLKSFFTSGSKDGKTLTSPRGVKDDKTKSAPPEDFKMSFLSEIYTPKERVELARNLLNNILPEDLDYIYFDGKVDNSSPGRKLAYAIALEVFEDLPGDPEILDILRCSFLALNDYERWLHCSLKLVEKDPDNGAAWENIAWCQMKLGRFEEALKSSEKSLRLLPNVPNVYDTHAAILAGMGKIDEAISVINKTMETINPDLPELNYQLGMLFEKKGDIKNADLYWRRYLGIVGNQYGHRRAIERVHNKLLWSVFLPSFVLDNKESLLVRMMLAHLLSFSILASLEKIPTRTTVPLTTSFEEEKRINEIKVQIGRFIEAICESYREIVDTILSSGVNNIILAQHFNLISLAYLLQGKLENVEGWLKKSLSLAPENPDSKTLLYAYYIIKVFKGVNEGEEYNLLQSALELNPKPCHAHILLARHHCRKKDFRKVEEICAEVKNAERKYEFSQWELKMLEEAKFGTNLWLGVARIIQGRDAEALSIFTDLYRVRPEIPELKYYMVVAHLREGDITTARRIFSSISSGSLPEEIYEKLRAIFALGSSPDEESLFASLRSPKMTGGASSPLGVSPLEHESWRGWRKL